MYSKDDIKKYFKRKDQLVTAVQINLNLPGEVEPPVIEYEKWGGMQTAKKGDWLLDNNGECYTVDAESFAKTYEEVSPGRFAKIGFVWAAPALTGGSIKTKEGESVYEEGDFIVFNNEDETDGYCMSAEKFNSMYEEDAMTESEDTEAA